MSFRSRLIEHFEVQKIAPKQIFLGANLGALFWLIWGHPVFLTPIRCEKHVIERPAYTRSRPMTIRLCLTSRIQYCGCGLHAPTKYILILRKSPFSASNNVKNGEIPCGK
jgi:hypothetical protein